MWGFCYHLESCISYSYIVLDFNLPKVLHTYRIIATSLHSRVLMQFQPVKWMEKEDVDLYSPSMYHLNTQDWDFIFIQEMNSQENKTGESSYSILPCWWLCWKQEPKGVITYTPKSDMTIHLGVVGSGSRPLDSLTPHCQLGLAGSYFPLCLCHRHEADKNIHNSRQTDPRGVGFQCLISLHSQKLQLT